MKTTLLKTSVIAVCLLASFLILGTETKAANSEPAPEDGETCYRAGFDAMCDGTRRGFSADGGPTAASCNLALSSLLGSATSQGCVIMEWTVDCVQTSNACLEPHDDDPPPYTW